MIFIFPAREPIRTLNFHWQLLWRARIYFPCIDVGAIMNQYQYGQRDRLRVSVSKWATEATDVVMWQIAQSRSHQSSSCPHSQPKQVSAPSGKYFSFLANNRESSDIHPRESLSSFQESLSLWALDIESLWQVISACLSPVSRFHSAHLKPISYTRLPPQSKLHFIQNWYCLHYKLSLPLSSHPSNFDAFLIEF